MRRFHEGRLLRSTINQNVVRAQYAVRGLLATRASEIKQVLAANPSAFPFEEVIELNIGNPQIFSPKTVSLTRNYLAELILACKTSRFSKLETEEIPHDLNSELSSIDSLIREFDIQNKTPSSGLEFVRKQVARFIEKRDLLPSDPANIVLTNGASAGISTILGLLLQPPNSGIMLSVPQYPLYSATAELNSASVVPYFLDEEDGWNIDIPAARAEYDAAREKGIEVRAIALINPGNPTGAIFPREKMAEILKFAHERNLVVLADEVYQENVYGATPWVSFKKVLSEMSPDIRNSLPLVSFHSISKGVFGDCGLRSGYYELVNVEPEAVEFIHNIEKGSRPNIAGQIILMVKSALLTCDFEHIPGFKDIMVNARKEHDEIFQSYKNRAALLEDCIRETTGMSSAPIDGALYAFPRLDLPKKFIDRARSLGNLPDTQYCLDLLETKGICTVPGNGFGQKEGTYHFRTTLLCAPDEKFQKSCAMIKEFQHEMLEKFS